MKIATTQYTIESFKTFEEYSNKITALIQEAAKQSVTLVLLPEYAGAELIFSTTSQSDKQAFTDIQKHLPTYLALFQRLATTHQLYIQAGTIPVEVKPGLFVNRAYFFSPDGVLGFQDKLQLTEFEKISKIIAPGDTQTIFATPHGKIGIAICYDSEFPEIVRQLVFAGCELILVPSYTSSIAGFYRVSLSARARAIENQCYVTTACIIGPVGSGGNKEMTYGYAGIFSPADVGFPDDGVIAQSTSTSVGFTIADIHFDRLKAVREKGAVHNFTDGKHQSTLGEPICLPC